MTRLVVFTGAGAAISDGLPSQAELFARFFSIQPRSSGHQELHDRLKRFLARVFFREIAGQGEPWPTFEEVLGVIDLAGLRREAIREILEDNHAEADSVSILRRTAVLAMALTVADAEPEVPRTHTTLVETLEATGLLRDTAFVTTNYDRSIERALNQISDVDSESLDSPIDYGLDDLASNVPQNPNRFKLYKVHGSLNWIACPVCDELQVKYESDVVRRLVDEPADAVCPRCNAVWTPVIVPPTYYKDMTNVFLATVWARAARTLRQATDVVFCGYSFPDADMHIKYLIKRAQLNRDIRSDPLRCTLVHRASREHLNPQEESLSLSRAEEVTSRYLRFLGHRNVRDANCSFEDFASDPGGVIERAHSRK